MSVGFKATAVRIVRSSGLNVDTTIGSTEMYFNAKGEVFRNSSRMHWSTSTGGWVGSSRNGLYFKREGFHSHPQDRFFWFSVRLRLVSMLQCYRRKDCSQHGLSVDTTIGSPEMYFNAKGELFRISPKMQRSTSTGGRVGSSRNGLYFKREGCDRPPQDRFFWIYSQSGEGKNASCWRGKHWEPVYMHPIVFNPLGVYRESIYIYMGCLHGSLLYRRTQV